MPLDAPRIVAGDMLHHPVEADEPRQHAGLLAQFAQGGGFDRLADLDQAAGQSEQAPIRLFRARREQNPALAEHGDADGQSRLRRIKAARQAHGYRVSVSQSPSGFSRV